MNYKHYILVAIAALLTACGKPTAQIPAQYSQSEEQADIYPDYTDIIVPPNIVIIRLMPLWYIFRVKERNCWPLQLTMG